ncbi:MAG: hypothetical protein LBF43_02745 [Puniceicoccales bacterium]|jgi:hypothetical protein|nr:hypothetical protein [Puniceicoccales bacterium]
MSIAPTPLELNPNQFNEVSSSQNPTGKGDTGRLVVQNQELSTRVGEIQHQGPTSLSSKLNHKTYTPSIGEQGKDLFSASREAQGQRQKISEDTKTHTDRLKAAQNEYNKESWVGKIGLKIQSHWKRNAYAQKIDYQDKLTKDIEMYPFCKSIGVEQFREENQNTIRQWLEGVKQCSPRRQPEIIKLILSKVIQTGNPIYVTQIKNWAQPNLAGKIDSYYYATPEGQQQGIQRLTEKIKNTSSKSAKSRLQNEFQEKLKGTFVKDEKMLNTLAGFIRECPPKARPALMQSVHERLQACGAPTGITNAAESLVTALKSSP